MPRRAKKLIVFALLAILLSMFACGGSEEGTMGGTGPAEISGRVIIAEKVRSMTAIAVPPNKDSDIFWIVDVSVRNNGYGEPVEASCETGYKGWEIIANGTVYRPSVACSEPIVVAQGQTGQFMFYLDVPRTLQINNAQICYKGQEPYSYGMLTGGDRVAAYDFDKKEVIAARETYWIGCGFVGECKPVELTTIFSMEGTGPAIIPISWTQTPWVINAGYTVTSSISYEFEAYVCSGKPESCYCEFLNDIDQHGYVKTKTVHFSGGVEWSFIKVEASGVEWWVKIGVE